MKNVVPKLFSATAGLMLAGAAVALPDSISATPAQSQSLDCSSLSFEQVHALASGPDNDQTNQQLIALEACPADSTLFTAWMPALAKSGNSKAQVFLSEHLRRNGETDKSIKWTRVAGQSGHYGAQQAVAGFYKDMRGEFGLRSAADYLRLSKELTFSRPLLAEDILIEAAQAAQQQDDTLGLQRVYMSLGNLNLYKAGDSPDSEFGEHGFSLDRAHRFYDLALAAARQAGDSAGELIGLTGRLAAFDQTDDNKNFCATYLALKSTYLKHKKQVDRSGRAAGMSSWLEKGKAKCRP